MSRLTDEDAREFPAKTVEEGGVSHLGISVRQHGLITAYVMRDLLELIACPIKEELVPKAVAVLSLLHDIGKLNPLFLQKLLGAVRFDESISRWAALAKVAAGLAEVYHAQVSAIVLKALSAPTDCAKVVAAHHGVAEGAINSKLIVSPALGGKDWEEARANLARSMMAEVGIEEWPQRSRASRDVRDEQLPLWTGLVILSDWISSRQEKSVPVGEEAEVASRLLAEAGFSHPHLRTDLSFEDLFGFHPRPVQEAFVGLYQGPGVYVLEAPTGCGKTEAALGLAYEALRHGDAGGIYFALPTMLTSDRLHDRVQRTVEKIAGDRVQLIHSGAKSIRLRLGKEGDVGGSWFTTSRRAMLAPFGVGTVDQALLAFLKLRFADLRRAGLLGKAVILDEIHSYDAYTSVLIRRLIKTIGRIGGTCIILSATLTSRARQDLLGLDEDKVSPNTSPIQLTVKKGDAITTRSLESSESRQIDVRLLDAGTLDQALEEALRKARDGMQVLWIENTVHTAQEIARRLQEADGTLPVGLLHSQFRMTDREAIEDHWIPRFSPEGNELRSTSGCILVGTQVLEQSLDLDADFLITRLAPMDLLIQRAGRLWRHVGTVRPESCRSAEMLVLAFADGRAKSQLTGAEALFGASARVYQPYLLYRTKEILAARLLKGCCLEFPACVRSLIEETYDLSAPMPEEALDDVILKMREELLQHIKELSSHATGVMSMTGVRLDDEDDDPCTRYIDVAQRKVLILEEGEVTSGPDDAAGLAIWADARCVRTPAYLLKDESISLSGLYSEAPVLKALRKMRRFAGMPILILRNDGSLVNLTGEICIKIKYSKDYGVVPIVSNSL